MSESSGFVTIKDLAGATLATEDDDLIIQQGEETKRINLKTLGDLLVFLDKIEQVKTSTENGGINEIKATLSDGSTATFTTQNGHGIQKIEQTVKSDVSSGTNVITATLSDGQKSNFEIKNGTGFTAETTSTADENGRTSHVINFNATDTTTENKTVIVKDGIGIVPEKSNQTTSSTINGDLNEFTFTLSDGSTKTIKVYNGRGKDFRISGVYSSIAAMQDDFENFALYEFAMIDTGSVEDEDTGKLFCRETEEWRYIGDLSGAQGIKGDTGIGIEKIETTESSADSGINIVKVYFTDGNTHTFQVLNGSKGLKGDTGASVIDITQTVSSTASSGKNVITFILEDGTKRDVEIHNGAKGDSGSSNVDDIEGVLPISKGGTGKNEGVEACNVLLQSLRTGSDTPIDTDTFISQYAGGSSSTQTDPRKNDYYRRPVSALWAYIKNKIASEKSVFKFAETSLAELGIGSMTNRDVFLKALRDKYGPCAAIYLKSTASGSIIEGGSGVIWQNGLFIYYYEANETLAAAIFIPNSNSSLRPFILYNSSDPRHELLTEYDYDFVNVRVSGNLRAPITAPSTKTNGDIWVG